MQLYIIRHAQSENNAHWGDDSYQESNDPKLTDLALSQIEHHDSAVPDLGVADGGKTNPQSAGPRNSSVNT